MKNSFRPKSPPILVRPWDSVGKAPAGVEQIDIKIGTNCVSLPSDNFPNSSLLSQSPLLTSTVEAHAGVLVAMANNPANLDPWPPRHQRLPLFTGGRHPQRVFAFLGTSVGHINENVSIAVLDLAIHSVDHLHVLNTIHSFLVNSLRLCNISISPSGLGAALVCFASALDRQSVMGAPHRLEPYWLIIPHDAGPNLRHLVLHRTCWLLLVNFPIDCLNEDSLATVVTSYTNLIQWHRSSNLARQLVLVNPSLLYANPFQHCGYGWG
jgi:hypothetical protein